MKPFYILLCLVWSATISAQHFEGQIRYINSYYSKTKGINDRQYGEMLGSREEYAFRNGNYLVQTNGSLVKGQLYTRKDNRIYSRIANSDTLYWMDAALADDSVLSVKINKGAITILNYSCNELVLTTKAGVHHYFFSPRFAIDPAWFEKHKVGNWNAFVKYAKALPLKVIIETPEFTFESFAIEVKPLKLEDSMFLPEPNAPLAKRNF
ncbi:MAG: hypothetical protein V4616_14800 [Bacteroidota bacterium]